MKINNSGKLVLKILIIMFFFYIAVMLVWNFTNTVHKPSAVLWDWRKEGYQPDPLHDRWKIN